MTSKQRWLWSALLLTALALRLAGLNLVPLSPAEALNALASLDVVRGADWPAGFESPLLLVGNVLLFAIFGTGDVVARLLPALGGVVLVGVPFLWRRELGEWGSLAAGMLIALSPLALFASRQVESTTLGLAGAALLVTALFRMVKSGPDRTTSVAAGVGLAVGLAGGPAFYDLLLSGVWAWLFYRWLSGGAQQGDLRELSKSLLWGLAGAFLIALGVGLRWNGWGSLFDGFTAWWASWRAGQPLQIGFLILLLYEPLALFLVLLGFVWASQRKEPFPLVVTLWSFIAIFMVTFRSGSPAFAPVIALFPLSLTAGYGVQTLVQGVTRAQWSQIVLFAAGSCVGWAMFAMLLSNYSYSAAYADNLAAPLIGLLLILLLQGLAVFLVDYAFSPVGWRGFLVGLTIALLALQISFASGLAFIRPTSPAEPVVSLSSSADLHNLRQMVFDVALLRNQRTDTLSVALVTDDPAFTAVLRWTLRDFERLRVVSAWPAAPVDLVITPAAVAASPEAGQWQAMSFSVLMQGQNLLPACQRLFPPICPEFVDWYLYRDVPLPPFLNVLLWTQP